MKIAILGAGSIGLYVGASLCAAGADVMLDVMFIGRARLKQQIAQFGITLTDLQQRRQQLSAAQIHFSEQASALATADLILVCVKSHASAAAAEDIARHARPDALIISLQNGIGNADVLRAALPRHAILGGMVPFNVVQMDAGRFHRGTFGELAVEASAKLAPWLAIFAKAHLPLQQSHDFVSLQWGKLLLNLNNAVNALAGISLKAELSQRSYRLCLAILMQEALTTLEHAGIKPAKIAAAPPKLLPFILRLPTPLFKLVAASMLKIDPEARSSMWEDLQAKRSTEIDYLNGAVVQLARQHGMDAPANRNIVRLVKAAEQQASATPAHPASMTGLALHQALLTIPE
jgi:2-dehydropantoate 2-reductase